MRRAKIWIVSGAALLTLAACAARLRVSEVTGVGERETIAGIPFRLRETSLVKVYRREASGTYKLVMQKHEDLPDMDRVYALGLNADFLSDHGLKLTFRPDGTLSVMDLKTDLKGDEALAALGKEVKTLSKSVEDFDKVEAQSRQARIDAGDATEASRRDRQAAKDQRNADAARALLAAQKAQLEYDALPSSASEVQKHDAFTAVKMAKLAANSAAREAGKAVPYPEEE